MNLGSALLFCLIRFLSVVPILMVANFPALADGESKTPTNRVFATVKIISDECSYYKIDEPAVINFLAKRGVPADSSDAAPLDQQSWIREVRFLGQMLSVVRSKEKRRKWVCEIGQILTLTEPYSDLLVPTVQGENSVPARKAPLSKFEAILIFPFISEMPIEELESSLNAPRTRKLLKID